MRAAFLVLAIAAAGERMKGRVRKGDMPRTKIGGETFFQILRCRQKVEHAREEVDLIG